MRLRPTRVRLRGPPFPAAASSGRNDRWEMGRSIKKMAAVSKLGLGRAYSRPGPCRPADGARGSQMGWAALAWLGQESGFSRPFPPPPPAPCRVNSPIENVGSRTFSSASGRPRPVRQGSWGKRPFPRELGSCWAFVQDPSEHCGLGNRQGGLVLFREDR